MFMYVLCLIYFIVQNVVCHYDQRIYNVKANIYVNEQTDVSDKWNNFTVNGDEKVTLQLYYESLCPYCSQFIIVNLTPVIHTLGQYLNIKTYPYGNAKTFKRDGKYTFQCQHGPEECYGNKLHACALDLLQNKTHAVLFNTCMMNRKYHSIGSDDNAADKCGRAQNFNATLIKECAKGKKGVRLLKYYGDESKKVNFNYVPYILINKKEYRQSNFMETVCEAFTHPPPACHKLIGIKNKSRAKYV